MGNENIGPYVKSYIHTQAEQVLPFLPINIGLCETMKKDEFARFIWTTQSNRILTFMDKRRADHLGKIASEGLSLTQAEKNTPLGKVREDVITWGLSGQELLVQIATTAVAAAVVDIMWAQLCELKERPQPVVEPKSKRHVMLLQVFDVEGKPEDPYEILYETWNARKYPSNTMLFYKEQKYVVIEVKMDVDDARFVDSVDIVQIKKVANQ